MNRLLFVLLLLCVAISARATPVTISEANLNIAIGPLLGGTIQQVRISWPAFQALDGTYVPADTKLVTVPASGQFIFVIPAANSQAAFHPLYNFTFLVKKTGQAQLIPYSATAVIAPSTPTTDPQRFNQFEQFTAPWWIPGYDSVHNGPPGGSGGGITDLTGDITATGPGSAVATLSTVNSNAGTFGTSTTVPVITVNGKGQITGVSTTAIAGTGAGGAGDATLLNGVPLNATPLTDGQTYVYNATAAELQPVAVPYWKKTTIGFSSVSATATSKTITLFPRAARQKVCGIATFITSGFGGTSITDVSVTVGDSNTTQNFYTPRPVSVIDNGYGDSNVMGSATGASNITATFTSTGGNLNAITSGSLDVDVCLVQLP